VAIAFQQTSSPIPDPYPLDAPLETILDIWYTVLGEAVLGYAYEELQDNVPKDWLMDNIRRVVARLILYGRASVWDVPGTPYVLHYSWNSTQAVKAILKLKG
jgi:hypothetical protein